MYTLALPDALPISAKIRRVTGPPAIGRTATPGCRSGSGSAGSSVTASPRATSANAIVASLARCRMSGSPSRSEEHTSELQSQSNLVCRLLLERKTTGGTINCFIVGYASLDDALFRENSGPQGSAYDVAVDSLGSIIAARRVSSHNDEFYTVTY